MIRKLIAVAAVATLGLTVLAASAAAKPGPTTKIRFKLDTHSVEVGDTVTGTVLVWTHRGSAGGGHMGGGSPWTPLEGAELSVRVDGTEVATVTTDADGLALISFVADTEGGHVMKVFYDGDDTHKRARRAQGFQVTPDDGLDAPAAPVLSATAGTASVSLSWTVPADGGSPITGYNVYRGVSAGTETLLVPLGVVTTYVDTTAVTGTTYYYVVTAVNAEGESVWSNEVSATAT